MDDIVELEVTGIAHGGVCVARHEGRVVFVSDAIPGERLRARLDAERKPDARFWRASTLEVLDASPHRRPHFWAEAGVDREPAERPGGADLGHIDIDHQRVLKRRVLQEALDRFAGGGLEAPEVQRLDATDGTRWRTRVTLHIDEAGRIGPFAARSHRVIEVADHPLARPAIAEAAATLRDRTPHAKAPAARQPSVADSGSLTLVEPGDGGVRIVTPGSGRETVWQEVGDRRFALDAAGFWQVHPLAAGALDAEVRALLRGRVDPDATHLDLYGGVGLFAATLRDEGAREIVSVESDARATAHAAQNVPGIRAVTARVDRFLTSHESGRGGVVVLDPPRAGAGRTVALAVARLQPASIIYIACDPVALARDLGIFRELGFAASTLRALDLFPHSHHVETVALLTPSR